MCRGSMVAHRLGETWGICVLCKIQRKHTPFSEGVTNDTSVCITDISGTDLLPCLKSSQNLRITYEHSKTCVMLQDLLYFQAATCPKP